MSDLTPDEVASVDPCYWACINKIQLQSGIYSLVDHQYQEAPMRSKARRRCYMKGTTGGFSEFETLRTLHGMIYGKYSKGVLVLFPTSDDVQEFSKSRFAPLIRANREAIGKYVKSGGKGTDTASLKKINTAFLYCRGARLTQTTGDEGAKEAAKLRSIQVDCVKFDEYDLMDEDAIAKAIARMGASDVKEEVYISNPTQEDYGIDLIWQQSDQRYWHRKCSCNEWTCAELTFPECVKTDNGSGYIACRKCGKPVGIWPGEWVAARPEVKKFEGYRWSRLTSIHNDPADILGDFLNPPQDNLGDVYRLQLGLPYSSKEDKLRKSDVLACCGSDLPAERHEGPCSAGVDVGRKKHVVIGIRIDKKRFEIIKTAVVESFSDIHDLFKRFNVKSAVIDLRPYEDEARQFQKAERMKIFLCEYSDILLSETIWNLNTGVVKVHRTGIFDATHRLITRGKLILPRQNPNIEEFARQCCNCARFQMKDKRTGTQTFRYRPTGDKQEHFRNALNYFLLASEKTRIVKSSYYGANLQKTAVHETTAI